MAFFPQERMGGGVEDKQIRGQAIHVLTTGTASWRLAADGGANRLLDVLNQQREERRERAGTRASKEPRQQAWLDEADDDDDDGAWDSLTVCCLPPRLAPFDQD